MSYNIQLLLDGEVPNDLEKGYYHVKSVDDFDTLKKIQAQLIPGVAYASIGRYGDDVRMGEVLKVITTPLDILIFREKLRGYLIVAEIGQNLLDKGYIDQRIQPFFAGVLEEWLKDRKLDEHDHTYSKCARCYKIDEALLAL